MSELVVEEGTNMGQPQYRKQEHACDDERDAPIQPGQDAPSEGFFGQSQCRLKAAEDLIRVGHGKCADADAQEQQTHWPGGRESGGSTGGQNSRGLNHSVTLTRERTSRNWPCNRPQNDDSPCGPAV